MDRNYDELIQNFVAFSMNPNIDVAIQYLTANDWDLTQAYNSYLVHSAVQEVEREEEHQERVRPRRVEEVKQEEVREPQQANFGLATIPNMLFSIGRIVLSPLSYIYSYFTQAPDTSFRGYLRQMALEPSPRMTALGLQAALEFARDRTKLLLVYIHQEPFGDQFLRTVLCDRQIVTVINDSYVLYGHFLNSQQAVEALNLFSPGQEMTFAIVSGDEVLHKLEHLPSKTELMETLMRFLRNSRSQEVRNIQDRLIREQQERELREAESIELEKLEQQRVRNEEIERRGRKEIEERRKKEEEIVEKNRVVGEEPEPGPGVSLITFRLPSGEKVERRFLSEFEVQNLYRFLEAKGLSGFELVFGYPSQVLSNGTLATEGLVPRAVVHVRLITPA